MSVPLLLPVLVGLLTDREERCHKRPGKGVPLPGGKAVKAINTPGGNQPGAGEVEIDLHCLAVATAWPEDPGRSAGDLSRNRWVHVPGRGESGVPALSHTVYEGLQRRRRRGKGCQLDCEPVLDAYPRAAEDASAMRVGDYGRARREASAHRPDLDLPRGLGRGRERR